MRTKRLIALLLVILALTSVASCDIEPPEPLPKSKQYYEYFNTVSAVSSYLGDTDEEFTDNCEVVEGILSEYHKLFDIYFFG